MDRYKVRWEIDVEADTPEGAAVLAWQMQRNPESVATVYEVFDDEDQHVARVDLNPEHG